MIRAGIMGSTGYTAGELIRILDHHPQVEIKWCYSHSASGDKLSKYHPDLLHLDLLLTDELDNAIDVIFLCTGHGHSKSILEKYNLAKDIKIIDLGNDFRLKDSNQFKNNVFIYGLVDQKKEQIKNADSVANPGCFATAIQLALLPLFDGQQLKSDIHIHGITGSTGAGKTPSATSHFSWRNNNISIYKLFKHQHLDEIKQSLLDLDPGYKGQINFVPLRGDFTRGIFISLYFDSELEKDTVLQQFNVYYRSSPFVQVTDQDIHLKQVINTNKCLIQIQKTDGKIHITSVLDNLLKGASGQAVENMNLMFNLPQDTGLNFKANYF